MSAEGLISVLRAGPYMPWLVGVTLVTAIVELVMVARARRRLANLSALRRQAIADQPLPPTISVPSRAAELIAMAGPGVVTALAVASIQHGRGLIWQAIQPTTALSEKATLLSAGVSEEMNALVTSLWVVPIAFLLGCFAAGFAVAARLQAAGLRRAAALPGDSAAAVAWTRYPGPPADALIAGALLLLAGGLGPVVQGGFVFVLRFVQGFQAVATVGPDQKAALFERLLDATRSEVADRWQVARIGVAIAVVIVSIIAVSSAPSRRRARLLSAAEPSREGRGSLILSLLLAAGAVAAWLAAIPMQRENEAPWPVRGSEAPRVALATTVVTAELDGPDPAEMAPVVELSDAQLRMNGVTVELDGLARNLDTFRTNHDLLRPNDPFNHRLALICGAGTSTAALVKVLRASLTPGYTRPEFLFLREDHVVRPLLGPLTRNQATAVHFATVARTADAEEGATIVKATDDRTCGDLAARLVELRRAGKEVALLVGR